MGLDVSLRLPGAIRKSGSGIWVRDSGGIRQLTREEWDKRFPGQEPVAVREPEDVTLDDEVYSDSITHNSNTMAEVAGLYEVCWRPEELGITQAKELIPLLKAGLERLRADPEKYRPYDPSSGWGSYEDLVDFVERYLCACEGYPEATVEVSR